MANEYFKYEELPKTGQKVRSKVWFSGVDKGTEGIVKTFWQAKKGFYNNPPEYGVDIQWNRWLGDSLVDGFSKTDYEWGLEEI